MEIRRATSKEIPAVVDLLTIILDDMELPVLIHHDRSQIRNLFIKTFQSNLYLNQTDIIMAVENDTILGVSFGYLGSLENDLFAEFKKHLSEVNLPDDTTIYTDKEAFTDEWYLNSLAVNPKFQGRGIGSKLLVASDQFAKKRTNKIGLLVDLANPKAEQLYQRNGFKFVKYQMLGTHKYRHLQKQL